MATQLGELQIESIEAKVLRGWFKSHYEGNVYGPSPEFGVSCLEEAWDASGQPEGALKEYFQPGKISLAPKKLEEEILEVRFETPNQESTFFEIEVKDEALFEGLEMVYWESYLLG